MRYNEILSVDLRARGLWIEEDDHFVYLRHTNEVIARWSATSARLSSIRNAARTWAKKHDKDKVPG